MMIGVVDVTRRASRPASSPLRAAWPVALVAIALAAAPVAAQSWTRTLEHVGTESGLRPIACCVRTIPTGGFVVAGHLLTTPQESFVTVLDDDGGIVWQKRYSYANPLSVRSLDVTSDGGFVLAAFSTDGILAARLDASGNVSWTTLFGDQGNLLANDAVEVAEAADGSFLLAGTTFNSQSGIDRAWLARLDASGSVDWQFLYHEKDANSAGSIEAMEPTADGGAVAAGGIDCGVSDACGLLLKIDALGGIDWTKSYDYAGAGQDRLMAVSVTSDGGQYAVGRSVQFGVGSFVQRTDPGGALVWAATMPLAPAWPYGVLETADGGALVPNATGNVQWSPAVLMKFDALGALDWQRAYGACGAHPIYDVDLAPGGFVFAGEASFRKGQRDPTDAWVARTASDGTITGTCPHAVSSSVAPASTTPTVSNETVQRSTANLPASSLALTVTTDTRRAFEACGPCVETLKPEVSPPDGSIPLRFTDAVTLSWDPGPAGFWTGFNVYRAVNDPDEGHVCHLQNVPGSSVTIADVPAPWDVHSFLVTGVNGDGESNLGRGSVFPNRCCGVIRCPTERRASSYCE